MYLTTDLRARYCTPPVLLAMLRPVADPYYEQTAVLPSGISDLPKRSFDKRLIAATFLLAIVVLAGFFGYRYLGIVAAFLASPKPLDLLCRMPSTIAIPKQDEACVILFQVKNVRPNLI